MQAGPDASPKTNASPNMKDPATTGNLALLSSPVCDGEHFGRHFGQGEVSSYERCQPRL